MKKLIIIFLSFILFSCNQQKKYSTDKLQNQIDSLENQLKHVYKPGFGEIMGNIQNLHSKLWFAGINKNWKLAEFEIHEMTEATHDIQIYQKSRKESEMMNMIEPALDSIGNAIKIQNQQKFKNNYVLLTNICNDCHHATHYEFIDIKVPEKPAFSNQNFKILDK